MDLYHDRLLGPGWDRSWRPDPAVVRRLREALRDPTLTLARDRSGVVHVGRLVRNVPQTSPAGIAHGGSAVIFFDRVPKCGLTPGFLRNLAANSARLQGGTKRLNEQVRRGNEEAAASAWAAYLDQMDAVAAEQYELRTRAAEGPGGSGSPLLDVKTKVRMGGIIARRLESARRRFVAAQLRNTQAAAGVAA